MSRTRVYAANYDDKYFVEVDEGDEHTITVTIHDEDGEKWIQLDPRSARALATVLCHEAEVVGT